MSGNTKLNPPRMHKERAELEGSENIEEVLEFLKTARTLKRQIKLIRGIRLEDKEEKIIKNILEDVKKQFSLFNVK